MPKPPTIISGASSMSVTMMVTIDGGAVAEGVLGHQRDHVGVLRFEVQLGPGRHLDLTVGPDPERTRIGTAQRVDQRVSVGIGVLGHHRVAYVVSRCVNDSVVNGIGLGVLLNHSLR